jgi:hypothetical protein
VKDIRRATRKQYSAEEKIRIVLDGLRGEHSVAERALAVDRCNGIAQMKGDAVLLVQGANEVAHVRSEHTFHRSLFRGGMAPAIRS